MSPGDAANMASQSSTPANITAEALNTKWDELVQKFDAYYDSLDKKVQSTLNAAIASWQDYFYGGGGETNIAHWRDVYTQAASTLAAAIPSGAKATTQTKATTQASKTAADTTFYVTGKVPAVPIPDVTVPAFATNQFSFTTPSWFKYMLYGGLGILGFKLLRKKR